MLSCSQPYRPLLPVWRKTVEQQGLTSGVGELGHKLGISLGLKKVSNINKSKLSERTTDQLFKKISRGYFYVKIMIMPLKMVSRFSRMLALIDYMP